MEKKMENEMETLGPFKGVYRDYTTFRQHFVAFEVWLSGCLNLLHVSGHFCFLKAFPKGGSGSARIGLQELDRPCV